MLHGVEGEWQPVCDGNRYTSYDTGFVTGYPETLKFLNA
jgi:hypothetical protein